ncbi:NAD(P)-binding protein [Actinopolymorpha pittospori]|uniref:Phytoene dehydrogenase-like protein n=1 Tax=Actinopolymorpha pittospori TaxID=648752 RepID=A0A927R882_9ACTN|nr:NAD(P)-binding protein [Actinopolymorpha pittospori]MBE1605074.1 phytoene dehydrogenase-like protein [Actinopolymorpha pittospori]
MTKVTVIGGGLGGLVAAVAAAEAGAQVELFEAHRTLGGRARSTQGPYVANDGPHVFYCDGPHWSWLVERGLVTPARRVPLGEVRRLRFRHGGRLRALPPRAVAGPATRRRLRAPVDQDFTSWASRMFGAEAARAIARMMGVVAFDADPGRLSAAFVWERFLRVSRPGYPASRYVVGGWQAGVDRLAAHARKVGVRIETGARVDTLPTTTPVIVATSLEAAGRLLGDPSLTWESGRTTLLDLGVRRHPGDAYLVFDLDEAGFLERFSSPDPTVAPEGHSLIQAHMPAPAGESKQAALVRLEAMLDLALPDWRERKTWHRSAVALGRTGALDLPGTTWRDRPAIDRGEGIYLVGDQVAAPGLLSEVTLASARQAAHLAAGAPAPRVLAAA